MLASQYRIMGLIDWKVDLSFCEGLSKAPFTPFDRVWYSSLLTFEWCLSQIEMLNLVCSTRPENLMFP